MTNHTSDDGPLATWRREADYWQTRIERSDDQAGGLMTACLTVGAVGTATAGYVQKHAPESRWMAIAGIIVVAAAGLITLASRTWLARLLVWKTHCGPNGSALEQEKENAGTRERVAKVREVSVGIAFFVFVAGLGLIAAAGFHAYNKAPKIKAKPTAASRVGAAGSAASNRLSPSRSRPQAPARSAGVAVFLVTVDRVGAPGGGQLAASSLSARSPARRTRPRPSPGR